MNALHPRHRSIDDDVILILEIFNKTTRAILSSIIDICQKRLNKTELAAVC